MTSITPNSGLSAAPKFGRLTDTQREKLGERLTGKVEQTTPYSQDDVFATAYEYRKESIETFEMASAVFNIPQVRNTLAKDLAEFRERQAAELDKALEGVKKPGDALSLLAAVERSEVEFPDEFVSALVEKAQQV